VSLWSRIPRNLHGYPSGRTRKRGAKAASAQVFDLIAGTSIGGILAIGLAAGVPAKTLRESFEANGGAIFPRFHKAWGRSIFPRLGVGMLRSRYNVDGLWATIEAVLANAPNIKALEDLKAKVLIASVDVTNNGPRLFGVDANSLSTPLLEVALATSAAPTYFPEHRFGTSIFVDGGLIADAPDVIALVHSLQEKVAPQIQMLSIGTVGGAGGEAARKPSDLGWLIRGKKLVDLT
jgi:patatin-like phospholipase/acyl hydrolase